MMKKIILVLMTVFISFSFSGCASRNRTEYFVRPEFNLGYVRTVAVLPFEDHVGAFSIAAHCRQITINHILSTGLFQVVEKMQVDSTLTAEGIGRGEAIDAPTLRRLGQLLGVQGFIVGSLDQTGQNQRGGFSFEEISLTMRLVDSESGLVLWHVSGRESGYSIWGRLFGLTSKDSYQVTTTLIRRLLGTMGQRSGGEA